MMQTIKISNKEDKELDKLEKCTMLDLQRVYQNGEKGEISKSDFKLEVDEIAMQVEELSAKTGGIPYTDILKEVADCLEL